MTTILRLPGVEPAELTVPELLLRNVEDHGELPALSWYAPDGARTTLTWSQARHRVAEVAAGFTSLGVGRGDRVLMMMGNRPEHWLSDLALVHLGAVPVSVYGTAAPEQIAHIARHSGARLAVVGGPAEVSRWEPLLGPERDAGRLDGLVVADGDGGGSHTPWSALARPYERADFDKTWRGVRAGDPVTVVYTSGTTGDPKGVVISHRNVILNGLALDKVAAVPDHAEHICYLPFAHIAERMLGIYLPVLRASHVHLCDDPARVAELAGRLHPAQFFGVPRVWEKLAAAVRAGLARMPGEQRAAVEAAGEIARAHVRCRERGERPSGELEAAYARARSEVIEPLLARAGFERLVWTASASAPMPPEVLDFWAGFGVVVMDAWGLTETTGALTLNGPGGFRLGSVGRPLEGTEIRTAPDGEIEVRGTTLFGGYLRADGSVEPATDAQGWFPTGDIGRIDEDGYLWLTDRKTEMIVTSTGKNVSPALVENTLKEHPLIGQALVHGDGRSYLVALLVLDPEAAPAWAAAHGIDVSSGAPAAHPGIRAEVERAVAAANSRLNRTEQVKRYVLLDREWSPETGELTPSLKLRRRVIGDKYGQEIDGLYEDHV
ncbi:MULTISPECIES: AMP-dependent synthetase/ligase [unclassified Streptomyces]|uniref:AMP-dependent synthetase/ligase n=1 Tax=unclassified Streptomyces TaxID=2593676 RepID=UPI002DD924BF|nr:MULTISPECIES: AMP-dependent synthetase/ligase [unclassified Streptomyces]WSA91108.1 AMP-dependent synthetase/ligase [Streptomyces sp. NBC_01795]WSB75433.1 AMP-dependent synthetase/ligase [Streptomyces sp. NBC_01775]WSS16285.1 AMP-dependent synthetase/ligase [Streptomyces sp. NBC_01186]WSS45102.1 AMP-dependent synthetase/ligase [Streptomyces sp. NBC_01187]